MGNESLTVTSSRFDPLVEAFCRGDQAAVIEIEREFGQALMAFLRGKGANHADAEDVAQATWLKAWEKRADFKITGSPWVSFRAFLKLIARNQLVDIQRRGNRIKEMPENADTSDESVSITDRHEATESILALRACLDELEESYRLILKMHYSGSSRKEIGETTGLPVGTVDSRRHRVEPKLKDCVQRRMKLGDAL